jgi:tape measure domain-containing protein
VSQTLEALVVELRADLKGFQSSLSTAASDVSRFSNRASDSLAGLQKSIFNARNAVIALGLGFAALRIGKSIVDAGMQMQALQNRMLAATGDAKVAANALQFVREQSERLGQDIRATADGFASFSAATLRAGLTLDQTKDIFTGVSEAAAALHLSTERTQLVFTALSQMASKGKVSMEELSQQLGDSLPGALAIFSKAMGVSTAEFTKMISQGKVLVPDLIKLGDELHNQFGNRATQAAQSAQAAFARLSNSLFELQAKLANSGILDVVTQGVRDLTKALNDPATVDGLVKFAQALAVIANAALTVASSMGAALYKIGEFETKALGVIGLGAGSTKGKDAAETASLRARVLGAYGAKQKAMSGGGSTENLGGYSLGSVSVPGESEAQKRAREKAARLRDQLRDKVESIGIRNAGETDPAKQAALEAEKQQKELEEALAKKAISEQEYRDASLQNEMAYQQKLTDIRQQATDLEVGMREKALNNIQGLLQVFAGKNKAIAIAMLAFDKARAIAQAIMETHVAAAAALKYDPTGATSAHVTLLGYANVAAIAATGIAQLATMGAGGGSSGGVSSTSSGSGSSDASTSTASATSRPTKDVTINLYGQGYSKSDMRQILIGLNDVIADGSRLNIVAINTA